MPPKHRISLGPAHRQSVLRSLVTGLFTHEAVSTTLPKARAAQIEAEKAITVVKRAYGRLRERETLAAATASGSSESGERRWMAANVYESGANRVRGYLTPSGPRTDLARLVNVIAPRFFDRPGGYTRIHKLGHRKGDHAPRAILELVDGPHDLKFFLAAMTVGRQLAERFPRDPWLLDGLPDFGKLSNEELEQARQAASTEDDIPLIEPSQEATAGREVATISADELRAAGARWPVLGRSIRAALHPLTLQNVDKACQYRTPHSLLFFEATARYHYQRCRTMQDIRSESQPRAGPLGRSRRWSEQQLPIETDVLARRPSL